MICRTCLIMQFILAFMNIWWYVYNLGFPLCWKLHVKIMQARKIHFSVFVKSAILFLVNLKNYNQSKNVALTVATCLFLHVFDDYSLPMHQNTVTNNLNYFHDLPYFASRHISYQESWCSWVIGVSQLRQDGEAFFILCFNLNW